MAELLDDRRIRKKTTLRLSINFSNILLEQRARLWAASTTVEASTKQQK